jgi:hypothetical protein
LLNICIINLNYGTIYITPRPSRRPVFARILDRRTAEGGCGVGYIIPLNYVTKYKYVAIRQTTYNKTIDILPPTVISNNENPPVGSIVIRNITIR